MSLQNITMLYGDGHEGESPQDFSNILADNRPAKFKYYVAVESYAMEWYTELKKEVKEKWNKFGAAFDVRWPLILATAKTQEEKEEEMTVYKLKEDLEAKKTLGGVEMWSHDLWSREVLCLTKRAGVASGKMYIAVVQKGLPSIIQDKIGTSFIDLQDFTTKVHEMPIVEITDYVKKRKRDKERQVKTEREIAELHSALAMLHLPTYDGVSLKPQLSKLLGCSHIDDYPKKANDEAGLAAYEEQRRDWGICHPGRWVDYVTPYPLHPSTVLTCTGECFSCGMNIHLVHDCPILAGDTSLAIDLKEKI
ncbi:hypothetical protein ARMGADRAFT_1036391 [Armillaria gallica]|uniref:CCHC-type domain-containing protein n=1 Tax=Armillaria gallica TaxID=47427 RepID=A0A2H3CQM0_ARMGA|nr:hypothetical protein ARMGADRAFT_1036391 [Armillaria gallica]